MPITLIKRSVFIVFLLISYLFCGLEGSALLNFFRATTPVANRQAKFSKRREQEFSTSQEYLPRPPQLSIVRGGSLLPRHPANE
jgi:hypothetical protein